MSTKTLRKRIALVAVSALGFGLMSVVPAKAADGLTTLATAAADYVLETTVGVEASTTVSVTTGAAANATPTADEVITSTLTLGFKPGGSNVALNTSATSAASKATLTTITSTATGWTNAVGTTAGQIVKSTPAASAAAATWNIGTFALIPDMPGVYKYVVTSDTGLSTATGAPGTVNIFVIAKAAAGTATGTASLTANWNGTVVRAGKGVANSANDTTDPLLTIGYPSGLSVTAGTIKVKVVTSADADLPVGTVIDGTIGAGAADAAGLVSETQDGTGTTAATFTFNTVGTTLLNSTGLYEFVAFEDSNLSGNWESGERFVTTSLTLAGTPTSYSIALTPSTTVAAGDTMLMDVTFTDSLARQTAADSESLAVTLPTGTTSQGDSTITQADAVGTLGIYRERLIVGSTAVAGTNTISMTGTVNSVTVAKTKTFTVKVAATDPSQFAYVAAAGIKYGASTDVTLESTDVAGAITVDLANPTVYYTVTGDSGDTVQVTTASNDVTTPGSRISSNGITYHTVLADGTVTFPVTVTTPVDGDSYTVTVEAGANDMTYTVTYADPGAAFTILPGTAFTVKTGSTTVVTGVLKDIYSRALAAKTVTAVVAGRNPSTATVTTGADGAFQMTIIDTSTATVTDKPSDTITLTYSYVDGAGDAATATGGSATITYSATGVVIGSMTLTPAATTTKTIDQVEEVAGVPSGSTLSFTASAKTAAGAAAASGQVITFTGSADDKFYLGVNTCVTVSGQCSVTVYRQKAGYSAITATAGTVTATSTPVLWSNNVGTVPADGTGGTLSTSARNVAVSAAQSTVGGSAATVIATVTDRWGNPVQGHLVTWSYSGVGRPVSGADTTVGTDSNGQAQFQVTALSSETGVMNVTATISGGQSANLAGYVTTTAVAGVTAGNTTATSAVTFTKDTSVSTADALLELAKAIGTGKEVEAAADAAAEAIDAANAATDAANLAAEAADAATVAAEEARDAADAATAAVEELSTQVATLMAALKAQLTTLANTVAKIAKKVKA